MLARFCIDETNEMMSSAINLMITSIINKDENIERIYETYSKLLEKCFEENSKSQTEITKDSKGKELFLCEITWILIFAYSNIFSNY